jgi:hypothetical protein
MSEEALPVPTHVASEFYAWLWWASEARESFFDLGGEDGSVEVWVDERLAFRNPNETKVTAVMTGDTPSTTLEARAALAGGKLLNEIRLGFRREDREWVATLKGPLMHLQGVKLPQVLDDKEDEVIYDRMFGYDELCFLLRTLFGEFAAVRTSPEWRGEVMPEIEQWTVGDA